MLKAKKVMILARKTFVDNSDKAIDLISDAMMSGTEDAIRKVETEYKSNIRVKSGRTRSSISTQVDKSSSEINAHVGGDDPNLIWEEYGTGEYAVNRNGRSGWWVYVKDGSRPTSLSSSSSSKTYTREEAARIMMMLREKGLDAWMTKGKKANPALKNAYNKYGKDVKVDLSNSLRNHLGG